MNFLLFLTIFSVIFVGQSAGFIPLRLNGASPQDLNSCTGRCNQGLTPGVPCQCNDPCFDFGDCCEDYHMLCDSDYSCAGRCGSNDRDKPCQCNSPCVGFGDCCPDYSNQCVPSDGVTEQEILDLSNKIWIEDPNNVASMVSIELQGQVPQGSNQDLAPGPLITWVDPKVLEIDTFSKLKKLFDNYEPDVGSRETVTEEEESEEQEFMRSVFDSQPMQEVKEFLIRKKFLTANNFESEVYRIWFGLYSRSGNILGSSGFEHIFLGEIKDGGVSGFHNWLFYHLEENYNINGNINYKGWIKYTNLENKGSIVTNVFRWLGAKKLIGGFWVGTSPEMELSLMTLCWYTRPNSKCKTNLGGTQVLIQTYDISRNGEKFVASGYPE